MTAYFKIISTICLLHISFLLKAQNAKSESDFFTRHAAGLYMGSYLAKGEPLTITPQAWIYFKNLYVEARYNYEDVETASVHFGKSISLSNDELELIPAAAIVFGRYNGLSAGLNINYETEKLNGFTQTQYCFSINKNNQPFYFSWLGLSTPIYKTLQAGASWQWLAQKAIKPDFDFGPMLSLTKGIWGVELYAYNIWEKEQYWQAALYFDLSRK